MSRNLTACIFARGGSKGVPRKNIREVGGKPLIAWSIACALRSRSVGRVVVSTDDAEIADIARRHGAETPFIRPAELATDAAPELLAWRHAIETLRALEGDDARINPFISTPATSPLRAPEDVDAAVDAFLALREAGRSPDLMLTVTPAQRHPAFNMVVDGADGWVRLAQTAADGAPTRRQDAPPLYDVSTLVYVADPDYLLTTPSLLAGRVARVVAPQERALDIDTEFDLHLADLLMSTRHPGERA